LFGAEFKKIGIATLVGFLIMGVVGFLIKLMFIPINQLFLA
jgi:preprotein translocase subunit Sss1